MAPVWNPSSVLNDDFVTPGNDSAARRPCDLPLPVGREDRQARSLVVGAAIDAGRSAPAGSVEVMREAA